MTEIFVLDTETTGLGGAAEGDVVVEIGIARVDLDSGEVVPEFGRVVHQELSPAQRGAWVFSHTDLTVEDVESSPWTVDRVRDLLRDYEGATFTAYNIGFDFGRFLWHAPWDYRPALAPCIMEEVAHYFNNGWWMRAQSAYDLLCPDNPAGVPDGLEEHRAVSDAVLEGHILLGLMERRPEVRERYAEVPVREVME